MNATQWRVIGFWIVIVGAVFITVALIIILFNMGTAKEIVVHKPVQATQQAGTHE